MSAHTMLRISLMVSLLCCFFISASYAEDILVGGSAVSFSVPDGYVEAPQQMQKLAGSMLSPDIVLHKMYVSKKSLDSMPQKENGAMEDYFVVTSPREFADPQKLLSLDEFAEMKKQFVEEIAEINKTLHDDLTAQFKKAGSTSMVADNAKIMDFFDDSPTQFSFTGFIRMSQIWKAAPAKNEKSFSTEKDKKLDYAVSISSTGMLTNGKLVMIHYYHYMNPVLNIKDQMNLTRMQAQFIEKNLNIDQFTPKLNSWSTGTMNVSSFESSSLTSGIALRIFLGGLFCVFLVLCGLIIWKQLHDDDRS